MSSSPFPSAVCMFSVESPDASRRDRGLFAPWAHRLMVVSLAGVIALVLFTIGVLDQPFSGGARIDPGAFELVLDRFETSKLSDL